MNTLPEILIAIPKFPGYFWHPYEQVVYSIKIDGVLSPLKIRPAYSNNRQGIHAPAAFQLSRRGLRYTLALSRLQELRPTNYEVPYR